MPTVSLGGLNLAIPGVRITLWLASAIIFGAGVLAARSMQMGIRASFKSGWNDVRTGELRIPKADRIPRPESPDEPGEEAS